MIRGMEKASGREIKAVMAPRRAGDIAECFADPAKAASELGWKATRTLEDMCDDLWRWQSNNPNGYGKSED